MTASEHGSSPIGQEADVAWNNIPTRYELVFGEMLHLFREARSNGDAELSDRIFRGIVLFEELWPEDTDRWKARHASTTSTAGR